jgi:dipeptidyl aminopeptidase/acylaminoacyl peptidase
MIQISRALMGALFTLVLVATPATALAQKTKGGTPTGTIYFRHDGSMWQMDATGTPASRLRLPDAPEYGEPSHKLHGGERWFVYAISYVPELAPTFPNQRQFTEICVGSTDGARLPLLSDVNLEIISEPRWSADDNSITFIAESWENVDGQLVANDAGAYELAISFAEDGTPQAGPLTYLVDLSVPLRAGPAGVPGYSDLEFCGYSWNSDGTQLAFGVRIDSDQERSQEIWISDLVNATNRLLVSGNGVGWPEWSPDDRRIAFHQYGQVVYDLATGRTKSLGSSAIGSWGGLRWAPSGAHVVLYHWDNLLPGYDALYRCTADLGGRTELTAGLADPPAPLNHFIPVGWRN